MDLDTGTARQHLDEVVAVASGTVVGLDFDGTLSPIVEDPARAALHPEAADVLVDLASTVRAVVVITGRPARQVVALAGFDAIADRLPAGARLTVLGQYGHERWDSETRSFLSPEPPAGLRSLREELPALLEAAHATGATVEEKGLAIAVHTRRLVEGAEVFDRLRGALSDAAARHDLQLEPGRQVLEVRGPGMHKGQAVRGAVDEYDARAVVFVGDDLGDLEAFEAVRDLRDGGLPALLVCSGSDEQPALVDLADIVVAGPGGVVAFLAELVSRAAAR